VLLPGSEPHCRGWMREQARTWSESLEAATLSRIFERVRNRMMTLKEEGVLYFSLPDLSRTISRAFLRDGGWNPWAKRGSRRDGRRECLIW